MKTWAPTDTTVEKKDCLSHHEVLTRLDGFDPDRGVKVVGHRGYCLTGYGLFLNLALVNYGLEFLWKKGYKPNQPPHFMLREYMAKTAQLEDFDEELYKVTESEDKSTDKYLIATSEQPLSALHDGEWMTEKDLPIKCEQIIPVTFRPILYFTNMVSAGTLAIAPVIERKLVLMERMHGVSSGFTNLKRYVRRYTGMHLSKFEAIALIRVFL